MKVIRYSIVLFTFFAFMACGEPETIKIGFIAGLTGHDSSIGLGARNMTELMIQRINQEGGIKGRTVELIVADGGDSVLETSHAISSVIEKDCSIIIGPFISGVAEACLDFADEDVLFLSPTISTSRMSGRDDNFIRFIPAVDAQSALIAEHIENLNLQSVAAVFDDGNRQYSMQVVSGVDERLTDGVAISIPFGTAGTENLLEVAERITEDLSIDCVVLAASGIDSATLIQYIHQKREDITFITSLWSYTIDFLEFGGRAVEGAYLVAEISDEVPDPAYLAIQKEYFDRYGEETTFIHEYTYDTNLILIEVLKGAANYTPEIIKKLIIEGRTFNIGGESLTIDRNGDCIRNTGMTRVENGRFVRIR